MPNFIPFISYLLIGTFTPGPNNIMSLANSSQNGFKKGFRFNLSVLCGTFIIFNLCAIFSIVLYKLIPRFELAFKVLGSLYILYLAYKTFKSTYSNNTEKIEPISFKIGFGVQFLNVKAVLYGLTIMSTFITPYYNNIQVVLFACLFAATCFLSTCLWSLFGSVFQRYFISHGKIINIILTLLLIYCAVSVYF